MEKDRERRSMKLFKIYIITSFFMIHCIPTYAFAQMDSLRIKIEQIVASAEGKIGVALQGLENNDTLTIDGNGKYPMQSVYKFPLALAVLSQVDKGTLSLDQQIYIKKSDLLPNTWSPLREKYPNGNIHVSLDELLTYTVSESDNNGCDILFRLVGGTTIVDQYIHNLGMQNIAIAATEEEMHTAWDVQYTNWSSPAAMCRLLRLFYQDSILSSKSQEFLWHAMEKTGTGPGRIKGLLPTGTIVAHKTGSSGTNDHGIAAATNDVGIVTLSNGKHVALVVFVSDSPADEKMRDNVIARIAKAAWDAFSVQ
jgi:beta-lactamase class A